MGTSIDAVTVVSGGLRRRHSARRLADAAARACLAEEHLPADSVDLLVNAGLYRDRNLGEPALAALIQEDIGANLGDPPIGGHGTFSFDVANGSAGVLTALQIVDGLLASGTARRALIVASDADPGRRMTSGFPFDATGGAALCSWDAKTEGFVGFRWSTFPEFADLFDAEVRFEGRRNVLRIHRAPEFTARAAACAAEVAGKILADHGLTTADVDAIVAAPPTAGFLDGLVAEMIVPRDQVVASQHEGVHTAALLYALDAWSRDTARAGARTTLFVAASAGITVGAALYRR
jgi:3-oxoacyl-[acyl-carrier-protein] synthase III